MNNLLKEFGVINDKEKIRLYWWKGKKNNFGDILGPYLVKKITKKDVQYSRKKSFSEYYLTSGSILYASSKKAIVWGSGILSFEEKIKRPKDIFAVRGPITRKRLLDLGINCPKVYGDPALLLPYYYFPKIEKIHKIGIIPHYYDFYKVNKLYNNKFKVINPLSSVEEFTKEILSCEKTISSSLHGIITSHAYNIPSLWVSFSEKIKNQKIKFYDYFNSVNIEEYSSFPFLRKIPDEKELTRIINKKNKKIEIDLDKLIKSCPFI